MVAGFTLHWIWIVCTRLFFCKSHLFENIIHLFSGPHNLKNKKKSEKKYRRFNLKKRKKRGGCKVNRRFTFFFFFLLEPFPKRNLGTRRGRGKCSKKGASRNMIMVKLCFIVSFNLFQTSTQT